MKTVTMFTDWAGFQFCLAGDNFEAWLLCRSKDDVQMNIPVSQIGRYDETEQSYQISKFK